MSRPDRKRRRLAQLVKAGSEQELFMCVFEHLLFRRNILIIEKISYYVCLEQPRNSSGD